MTTLDAAAIIDFTSRDLQDRLAKLRTFDEIESTNSYLMQIPGPVPGKISIAVTTNQTAGRGRHGRRWQSPPGSGLCLSAAYTFARAPDNLPALTLAIGLGALTALQGLGAAGVQLKWPNDLVVGDGKLGGILTEAQPQSATAVTVVTGIGVNIDLPSGDEFKASSEWARRIVDMKRICTTLPGPEEIAGRLTSSLLDAFVDYDTNGFTATSGNWAQYDWLLGRECRVDTSQGEIRGIGAGIDDDGALLIKTADDGTLRVMSGSILEADTIGVST